MNPNDNPNLNTEDNPKLKPIDNPNMNPEDNQNMNPEPPKIEMEIDANLWTLWTLCHELKNTRDPTWLSLDTSLEEIISSIIGAQEQLTDMSKYMATMFQYYKTGLSNEQVRT